ncbi:MAG: glycoside hydrolase family 3 C-terminal domain-containing protein, partial [Pygmaiobacter sp.]|nr:glycoside hydrolase family 3 C-terminal domain-containing protein [Pygmaiobacter sp.]
ETGYIGAFAKAPRARGGGWSHINCRKISSALESANARGRPVTYTQGFPADRYEETGAALQAPVQAARQAKAAVIFAGLPDSIESEGYDRTDMALPACQNRLIEAVAAVQPNTVVVLHNGSPVETPWADKVAAVLEMYLGGQGVGEACDRLLYGEAVPCGRLAETFPLRVQDNPSYLFFPGDGYHVRYAEDIYVGYRYYEAKQQPVRWAFGHGLSYTTFAYSNLHLSQEAMDDDSTLTVTVEVTNTGKVAAKEVVQLYVADKNGTPNRPCKELKGFAKVLLAPGETQSVSLTLTARDLSFYHEGLGDWYAPAGRYKIMVGHASDEIALAAALTFTTRKQLPLPISGATTLGELLEDARTGAAAQTFSQQAMQGMGGGAEEKEGDENPLGSGGAAMMAAMLKGMPLKSLASFGGQIDLDKVIADFTALAKE